MELKALLAAVSELTKRAIASGRIICVQESSRGAVVVPGAVAKEQGTRSKDVAYCYVLTADLPVEWFTTPQDLPKLRAKAVRFAENALKHFDRQGRTASKADIKAVLMEELTLSENAVLQAWKKIDKSLGSSGGNIPKDKRVSIDEIRDLWNNWGD